MPHVGVLAWLVGDGLATENLIFEGPLPSDIQEHFAAEAIRVRDQLIVDAREMDRLPPTEQWAEAARPVSALSEPDRMFRLVAEFYRRADHRGCDVRLDVGTPFRPAAWPRQGVATQR